VFDECFEGKRVLVTGVAGVKGTWLALMLLRAGAAVTGLDKRRAEVRSNYSAAGLGGRIRFVQGDVRDLALVRDLVNDADCVFHLAAEAIVGEALRNPLEAYSTNTLGTATVLESLRLGNPSKRAVFITTDKVYRPKNGELWLESDELGANGPYAVSKACAEWVIRDYKASYFSSKGPLVAVGRAGNVVVGGDLHSSRSTQGWGRIFVDCFEALSEGRSPAIFRPTFTRPYTYGLDIISGYMTLMSRLDRDGIAGEAFNFGPYEQFGVSNALLATKICDLWGSGILWQGQVPREEPFDYQSLSTEKSRRRLGWRPAFTLYEALSATTAWYKAWAELGPNLTEGCLYELDCSLIDQHRAAAARLGIEWTGGTENQEIQARDTGGTGRPV
jgi:CDP-glucose 4,6-dehydratase